MALQYARLFQFRAGIQLIVDDGPLTKEELEELLRQRKDIDAPEREKVEGAEDIIGGLRRAHLVTETEDGYKLTTDTELEGAVDGTRLLYSGEAAYGAGDQRAQADRILGNIMYEHPMLIRLSKFVFRRGPVKKYEVKREFDGQDFLGDVMNEFTIDMGLNLLEDADIVEGTPNGYVGRRWPIRVFTHVVHEEFQDLTDRDTWSLREPDLFERLETVYGIDREAFDSRLDRLHAEGIVSEGSYQELVLNVDTLKNIRIHE